MKRLVLPLALAFTLLCGFTLSWKEFRSDEGRFAVSMPGAVESEQQEVDSDLGVLQTYTFSSSEEQKKIAYLVAYTDYPLDSAGVVEPSAVLDGARDGMLGSPDAVLVREREIKLSGFPGRDIEMKTGEWQMRFHLYMAGSRLYQVIAVVPAKTKLPKSVDRFLSSFKLMLPK